MAREGEDRTWTVGGLLHWTRDFFRRRGLEEPRLNAELLLAHALGWRRIDLYTRFDAAVEAEARARFRDLVRRRAGRVPLAYLTNSAHFLTITLYVDERVAVPRPETETLVEAFEARVPPGPADVVDVGTGSGAVAVAVALRRADVRVTAIDVSPEALEVARRNVRDHGLEGRVELVEGDLLAPLRGRIRPAGPTAVLANLPYVSTADLEKAQPEVRDHEPRIALDGGPDGLAVIRRLVAQAPQACPPGAWLMLEVGAGQAERVVELLSGAGGWEELDCIRDLAGHERVVAARRRRADRGDPGGAAGSAPRRPTPSAG